MANQLPPNHVKIVIHEFRFEVRPKEQFPIIRDKLKVTVDWTNNDGKWSSVTVRNFRIAGQPVPTQPKQVTIPNGDAFTREIRFPTVSVECRCTYEVGYVPDADPTNPYIVDPTLIIMP